MQLNYNLESSYRLFVEQGGQVPNTVEMFHWAWNLFFNYVHGVPYGDDAAEDAFFRAEKGITVKLVEPWASGDAIAWGNIPMEPIATRSNGDHMNRLYQALWENMATWGQDDFIRLVGFIHLGGVQFAGFNHLHWIFGRVDRLERGARIKDKFYSPEGLQKSLETLQLTLVELDGVEFSAYKKPRDTSQNKNQYGLTKDEYIVAMREYKDAKTQWEADVEASKQAWRDCIRAVDDYDKNNFVIKDQGALENLSPEQLAQDTAIRAERDAIQAQINALNARLEELHQKQVTLVGADNFVSREELVRRVSAARHKKDIVTRNKPSFDLFMKGKQ